MRSTRLSLLIICLGLLGIQAASAAAESGPREPFFPHSGNEGYDVLRYEVELDYRGEGRIFGETSIAAVATQSLNRVSLDFRGPRVAHMSGDVPGRYRRRDGKLIFFPVETIPKGSRFSLDVSYGGVPPKIVDPDGTVEGWYRTDDGVLALGEPQGTTAWIPCNNVPGDKAKFEFAISAPDGLKVVANGRFAGRKEIEPGRSRFFWREAKPMSPYLAVLNIGRGRIVHTEISDRIGSWTLVDPRLQRRSRPVLAQLPELIRFEGRLFGAYPFDAAGSIVDYAPGLGYALETQTRPIYPYVPDLTTVVHETAHQWFGDSVGLERWPEIWLNEGFATWTEWYYAERHGRRSAQATFDRLYRVPASNEQFWNPPSGHPGTPKHLFGPSVYVRGAMTLQALRIKIGTTLMLRALRRWAIGHRYGSGTIKEFTALAENLSGRDLDPFFQRWLYRPGKP